MGSAKIIDGVRAKMLRAQQQLTCLEGDITRYCQFVEGQICHEVDVAAGRQIWVYRGENDVPVEFSVRVGEVIHNLRSSLDHLITQLVLANGQQPTKRNAFPIFRSKEQYQKVAKEMLQGLHEGTEARIELLQPLKKHGGMGSQLWMLHCLSNVDKHRYLNMTSTYMRGPHIEIKETQSPVNRAPLKGYGKSGVLKRNSEILAMDNPNVELAVRFKVDVVFDTNHMAKASLLTESSDSIEAEFDLFEKHSGSGSYVVTTLSRCLRDVESVCHSFGVQTTP